MRGDDLANVRTPASLLQLTSELDQMCTRIMIADANMPLYVKGPHDAVDREALATCCNSS